ncbi:MAG: hypothetical protein ABIP75_17275 [Pyrinomonadaceae bacterium]
MTEERTIAYLLEELPPDEAERFEDELFAANEWPAEVRATEDELIDSYLRRELTPERRTRFEENYLCTEARRDRVAMAAAVLRRVDELCEPTVPESAGWWQRFLSGWKGLSLAYRTVAVAACLVLAMVVVWLVIFRTNTPQTFATLTVPMTNATRGGGAPNPSLTLPLGKDALELTLILSESAQPITNFKAEVKEASGRLVPVAETERDGRKLIVTILTKELVRGSYEVKVSSVQPDGSDQRIPGGFYFDLK